MPCPRVDFWLRWSRRLGGLLAVAKLELCTGCLGTDGVQSQETVRLRLVLQVSLTFAVPSIMALRWSASSGSPTIGKSSLLGRFIKKRINDRTTRKAEALSSNGDPKTNCCKSAETIFDCIAIVSMTWLRWKLFWTLYSELSNSNKDVRMEKPYLQYSSSDERWW